MSAGRKAIVVLVSVVVAFVLFSCIWDLAQDRDRPLFSNLYATHSMGFLPRWQPTPPHSDRARNIVAVDEKLNLLVIAFNDEPQKKQFYWGGRDQDHAELVIQFDQGETPTFERVAIDTINRRKDYLIVLDLRANVRFEASLEPGEGPRLYALVRGADYYTSGIEEVVMPVLRGRRFPSGAVPLPPRRPLPR